MEENANKKKPSTHIRVINGKGYVPVEDYIAVRNYYFAIIKELRLKLGKQ